MERKNGRECKRNIRRKIERKKEEKYMKQKEREGSWRREDSKTVKELNEILSLDLEKLRSHIVDVKPKAFLPGSKIFKQYV